MKDEKFMKRYYHENMALTKKKVRESVSSDNFIVQCVNSIDEIEKTANLLSKRLREWYELMNPEFSREVKSHESFIGFILKNKDKKIPGSMGADIHGKDKEAIMELAINIQGLYSLKQDQEDYLEKIMQDNCPNINAVSGSLIGGRLLEHAGSLKRLSLMTASKIQLLGAEKALFRHMKTGAKAPKHGLILNHPLLQKAKPSDRGKAARALSDKIAIAAKVDYFKGEFVGDRLKKELTDRFGSY